MHVVTLTRVGTFTILLLAGAAFAFAGGYGDKGHPKASKDIVDTAIDAGSFKTLVTALKAADLVETLKGKGPFTVFAPTDEAFAKLPGGVLDNLLKAENKGELRDILTYHVVPGTVVAAHVTSLQTARTVNGKPLTIRVDNGAVMVDEAKVIKTDIMTSNGVIHVIDAVVIPKDR